MSPSKKITPKKREENVTWALKIKMEKNGKGLNGQMIQMSNATQPDLTIL